MRKLVVFLSVLAIVNACRNDKSEDHMFSATGIPETDQSFSYMYFKNENEGYLFGTGTTFLDMTEENLNTPGFVPEAVDEANIFKTVDGGNSWIKIDSLDGYRYQNVAAVVDNFVYIESFHAEDKNANKIAVFDMTKDVRTVLVDFSAASAIWGADKGHVLVSESRRGDRIYEYSNKMTEMLDSIPTSGYALKGIAVGAKNFIVKATKEKTSFVTIENAQEREVPLPLVPADIIKPGKDRIIVAGNNKDNTGHVQILSYSLKTGEVGDMKIFEEYSIVQGLHANKEIITGFVGNISDAFTSYDLIISLDHGRTWRVKPLNESRYIRPSCLINSTLFIYSGAGRLQKIPL